MFDAWKHDQGPKGRCYQLLSSATASVLGRRAVASFAVDLAGVFDRRSADSQTMWIDGSIALSTLRQQR
jgi:hypothetical protein